MNIIEYGTTFKYHSTCEYTDFLENPDPYHLGGVNGELPKFENLGFRR